MVVLDCLYLVFLHFVWFAFCLFLTFCHICILSNLHFVTDSCALIANLGLQFEIVAMDGPRIRRGLLITPDEMSAVPEDHNPEISDV